MLSSRPFKKLFTALFTMVMISGCSHQGSLVVYDREVCADLAANGAYCEHTFINKKRSIPKAAWEKERVGWFCTNSRGETDIETLIDQACTELNCSYEQREELLLTKKRMARVRAKAQHARTEKGNGT